MKIDAPKAWSSEDEKGKLVDLAGAEKGYRGFVPVRIVRESDWRRIMAVVRAADNATDPDGNWLHPQVTLIGDAVVTLRKHLSTR